MGLCSEVGVIFRGIIKGSYFTRRGVRCGCGVVGSCRVRTAD